MALPLSHMRTLASPHPPFQLQCLTSSRTATSATLTFLCKKNPKPAPQPWKWWHIEAPSYPQRDYNKKITRVPKTGRSKVDRPKISHLQDECENVHNLEALQRQGKRKTPKTVQIRFLQRALRSMTKPREILLNCINVVENV